MIVVTISIQNMLIIVAREAVGSGIGSAGGEGWRRRDVSLEQIIEQVERVGDGVGPIVIGIAGVVTICRPWIADDARHHVDQVPEFDVAVAKAVTANEVILRAKGHRQHRE